METTPTWDSAKHLLGESEGAATEIFVIGLALSRLSVVVAAISDLPALEVMSFDDEELEVPEPFDRVWRSRLESAPSGTCQRSLRSANSTARHLQIYLWADAEESTIEVELVFWNDLTFPCNLEAAERDQRLRMLVSLAEACRTDTAGALCILAPEHNGPTEELLEGSGRYRIVW